MVAKKVSVVSRASLITLVGAFVNFPKTILCTAGGNVKQMDARQTAVYPLD